jgi:tetratricopeptide (TPR) repeat protein
MKECNNKQFGKMLEAYELGMLGDDDRQAFELHLYTCEYCFDKVREFEKASLHIRENRNVQKSIREMSERSSDEKEIRVRRKWRSLVPTTAIAVIILFLLVIKPWDIQIQPDLRAFAENRLTIFYFENTIDPEDEQELGNIITNLLITDLAESKYLQVLSSQRLADIIQLMEFTDSVPIDQSLLSSVAKKADARWILYGSILQMEPNIVLTSQIIDAKSGNIISSQKVSGRKTDDLFDVVDLLSVEIKNDLSLPDEALDEADPMISDITTHSPKAYWYYLEGVDNFQKMYREKAIKNFEKALEYDSTFAMVYYFLANLKDKDMLAKAKEYMDNSSTISRYYIKAVDAFQKNDYELCEKLLNELIELYPEEKYAYFRRANLYVNSGDYEKALESLRQAVQIDPLYKLAYNQLVYIYSTIDDFENALWAIDKYIEIAPDEANPYDTRGDLYAANGMIANAIDNYLKALEVESDFQAPLFSLGLMYLYQNEYQKADSCFTVLINYDDRSVKRSAALYRTYILVRQGKFNDALEALDRLCEEYTILCYNYHFIRAQIYWGLKEWESAINEIESTVQLYSEVFPDDKVSYRYMYAQILAEGGKIDMANELANELKIQDKTSEKLYYQYALGAIEMAKNNYSQSSMYFINVEKGDSRFFIQYLLAKSYLFFDRTDEAIEEFEKIVVEYTFDRAYFVMWSVDIHYYLGMAYENAGDFEKAIRNYEIFLDVWGNADCELIELNDARQRLIHLKSRT